MFILILRITLILVVFSIRTLSDQSLKRKITIVKQIVIETCTDHPESYYPLDLEQFKTKDWIIERYLKENNMKVNEASQSIVNTLHFYKAEKLGELKDNYFPAEFYATGLLIDNGLSKKNEPVSGCVLRCLVPFGDISKDMYELGRKFLLYFLYKHRMELDPGSRLFFIALDRIEYFNLDLRFLYNGVNFMNNYIPQQPGTYLVLDLGWIFKLTFQALTSLVNTSIQNKLHFSSMRNIGQWVDPQNIPTYAGGNLTNFKRIPDGVKSGKCLDHLKNITNEQWDIFRDKNIKCIIEGVVDNDFPSIDQYLRYC